jgi:hypothetical protein
MRRENARYSLAVEIHPLVLLAFDPCGYPQQALPVEVADLGVELQRCVVELDRRVARGLHGAVGRVRPVAMLDDGSELRDMPILVVAQLMGAGEDRRGPQLREAVEEQDACAAPVGPDLESRTVGRERIRPQRPRPNLFWRAFVLPLIENELKIERGR